jgi:serine/threonine protein phosphatase PrpC
MFAGKWFERGLGQFVAPDKNYKPKPEELEQTIFSVVAPKDNTKIAKVPPTSAFPSSIVCENCRQATKTPRMNHQEPPTVHDDQLRQIEQLVLECAKTTASKLGEASDGTKNAKKVLEFCTNNTEAKTEKAKDKREKSKLRIRLLLENNPDLFTETRAYNMNYPPDGFTPLMAAALSDNLLAAQLLLELGPVELQLQQRDFLGRTALHIGAEKGSAAVLEFLRPHYVTPPLDLNLRTAYGSALLSPEPSARKLARSLYQPNDRSILGSPQPQRLRVTVATPLMAAWADMPGHRITMEDAIVTKAYEDGVLLAAVCDGHGDGGKVSKFVAEQLQKRVTLDAVTADWWKDTCLEIDANLKKTSRLGGSTASIAFLTPEHIVVANVGDSRCILIQKGVPEEESSDNPIPEMAALALHEQMRVISLTHDHKPNLPDEQARIEAAGLSVVEEKYEEDGAVHTLYKVALSKENLLATSRAFGDFEYKTNKDLPADRQAVVAVPDVVVRQRSKDDLFMVVACDGIWDVMSPQQVGDLVLQNMTTEAKQPKVALVDVADKLLQECLNLGSRDNMSVVVVALSDASELPPRKALDFK